LFRRFCRRTALKRVLVTGSNGFIGSHAVETLLRRGYGVRCLVRRDSDRTWLKGLDVDFHTGELGDPASLETAIEGADWILHLAGRTKASSRETFFRANADGTANLLRAAVKARSGIRRFVYVSSIAAAGPDSGEKPLTEDDPPRPVTWYGESKLEGERIAASYGDRIPVTIIRPPVVFGPRDPDVLSFFRSVRSGFIPRLGGKDSWTGFVYVDDLVRGLVMAAESETASGRTYYLATEGALSWTGFGRMIAECLGKTAHCVPVPLTLLVAILLLNEAAGRLRGKTGILNLQKYPEYRNRFWRCDASRAERELGFRPAIRMEDAVARTSQWYREAGWL
jgi:dihydroflavonol-4-reductase